MDDKVKDFTSLDKELESVKDTWWDGKDLPFPVLIDATGTTQKNFDPQGYPTTLLIDPEGTLVGEVGAEALREKLPALPPKPLSQRIARAMDRNTDVDVDDTPLETVVAQLAEGTEVPIRLDTEALQRLKLRPDEVVPLKLSGMISLRSSLNLILEAFPLTYEVRDDGVLITALPPGRPRPAQVSAMQKRCVTRINGALEERVSFDFNATPLQDVASFFEQKTGENFILSPAARKAGAISPATPVSGSAKDRPLRQALTEILSPLNVTLEVRDELVVLVRASGARPGG